MSKVQWNPDQETVIGHRKGNLLVSAAAGSGKTAVMIERLVGLITDPEDHVDVDELLVMTFTNAAAAQMRDKLTSRLREALREVSEQDDPGSLKEAARLSLQLKKLKGAHVMTIHAFCLEVIREYVTCIEELDPGFRIADDTEAELLKSDVLADVLEDLYQLADDPEQPEGQAFLRFVDRYSGAKQDSGIEEQILRTHRFLESQADPDGWMERALKALDPGDQSSLKTSPWYQIFLNRKALALRQASAWYKKLADEFIRAGLGPDNKILLSIQQILSCLEQNDVPGAVSAIPRMNYKAWKEDPAGEKRVKGIAEKAKSTLQDLNRMDGDWFDENEARNLREEVYPAIQGLAVAMNRFREAYQEAKRERGIVDFSDLERFALRILIRDGVPTREAMEIRDRYRYISIDEYQDSNDVQEAVIQSIARKNEQGDPINVFMVGDVKQSIYKFRQSRPELFLDKQERYPDLADADVAYLHQNYRSRSEILDAVNSIFFSLMYKPTGEIDYTEQEALVPGRTFPAPEEDRVNRVLAEKPVLYLLDSESKLLSRDAQEAEVDFTAKAIQTLLTSGVLILDAEGTYRPVRPRDIAILMRNNAQAALMQEALTRYEVPSFSEVTTGFYQTKEIQCVINILKVIDNPRQDIPLAGALYSPMFGFSAGELAALRRVAGREVSLYEALLAYPEAETDTEVSRKTALFLEMLSNWRREKAYLSVYELIWQILKETGYYLYASSAPDGKNRRANLDLLMTRAAAYEKGSYRGLFHFLRYIAKMEEQSRDEEQALFAGEEDDVVRIMSIHKSKGLQFPVVYVIGLGHRWNQRDSYDQIILDAELGIGPRRVDSDGSFYYETLPHRALAEKKRNETLAEEMRVLYVALTRAEQALYCVGFGDPDNKETLAQGNCLEENEILSAGCFLDWLIPIAKGSADWTVLPIKLAIEERQEDESGSLKTGDDRNSEIQDETYQELESRFAWSYPDLWRRMLPARVSVSQLKKADEAEPMLAVSGPDEEERIILPSATSEENAGNRAGTAIHKALSLLDLTDPDIKAQMDRLHSQKRLSDEEMELIPLRQLEMFSVSQLADRMRQSAMVLREQPFIVDIPMEKIREWVPDFLPQIDKSLPAAIMVQGIIDCCFVEDDRWIIVDYKSDRVLDEKRRTQYGRQLDLYAYALRQITGRDVSEQMLYATRTGECIYVG